MIEEELGLFYNSPLKRISSAAAPIIILFGKYQIHSDLFSFSPIGSVYQISDTYIMILEKHERTQTETDNYRYVLLSI